MTATRAIGWFFGAVINRIVRWLAKEIMTRPDLVLARIERALLV